MSDLVAFIRARADEDEAAVKDVRYIWPTAFEVTLNPDRVLREVAAIRAIVDEVISLPHINVDDCWYSCSQAADPGEAPGSACCDDDRAGDPCDCGRDQRVERVLRALAAIWAGPPGLRPGMDPRNLVDVPGDEDEAGHDSGETPHGDAQRQPQSETVP